MSEFIVFRKTVGENTRMTYYFRPSSVVGIRWTLYCPMMPRGEEASYSKMAEGGDAGCFQVLSTSRKNVHCG